MANLLKSRRTWAIAVVVLVLLVVGWHLTAYQRGALMARLHHARGHYEVKVFGGLCPFEEEYARLLEEKYGVKCNRVAYCVVPEALARYAEGYNSTCERLLTEKYGKDVIQECFDLAQERWRAKHPQP